MRNCKHFPASFHAANNGRNMKNIPTLNNFLFSHSLFIIHLFKLAAKHIHHKFREKQNLCITLTSTSNNNQTTTTTYYYCLFLCDDFENDLFFPVGQLGSSWHVAKQQIVAPYKAFSREKVPARLGVHIGLMHVNITLSGLPVGNWSAPDIDFNERFNWNQANDMGNSYKNALKRGLPYPILTVAEYFSLGQEGFAWGGQYRAAGYYASIWLW